MKAIRIVDVRRLRTSEQRTGVVYVGRAFAGWPESPLHNPFRLPPIVKTDEERRSKVVTVRMNERRDLQAVLQSYCDHLQSLPDLEQRLLDAWTATENGVNPLGCWCVNCTYGDGTPICCHAQIIAAMLHERFIEGQGT